MSDVTMRYMTVSLDLQANGFNITGWMSTVEFWIAERAAYPHRYTAMGDACTWLIHSNTELTVKMIATVTEYCDRICREQTAINNRRKLSNR